MHACFPFAKAQSCTAWRAAESGQTRLKGSRSAICDVDRLAHFAADGAPRG